MLKNYVTIAIRNLWRRPAFSLLNITGLTVGMACGIMILLAVRHDLSYDRFHEKSDRIFRVVTIDQAFGVSSQRVGMTMPALGPAAEAALPEIEAAVRMDATDQQLFSVDDREFYTQTVFFADPPLFRVFDFPLLQGSPDRALSEPSSVVLSESMARRLFGESDPLGRVVRHNHQVDLHVTGVVADPPPNSHLQFDAFISLFAPEDNPNEQEWLQTWNGIGMITYFVLDRPEAAVDVEAKLEALLRDHDAPAIWSVTLQPLTDVHLASADVVFDVNAGKSDIAYVWGLGLVGLFVLLIAAFNFMNLSTARSTDRAREVGVRKVSGALPRQLIGQHLGESVILGMISFVLALVLVAQLLPVLAATFNRQIGLYLLFDPLLLAGLFALALLASLLAGSYPAFILSRFQPLVVLKGSFKRSARGELLRKGLVVTQFAASVVMIVGTLVVSAQLDHIMKRNMGYNRDQVVALSLSNQDLQANASALREELVRNPSVIGVARSSSLPGRGFNRTGVLPEGTSEDDVWITSSLFIDDHFLDLLEMELAAGRNFSRDFGTDAQEAVIINEAAARELGWNNPLDRTITIGGQARRVVGVVKDFHFASVRHRVEPLIMLFTPDGGSQMSVRMSAADVTASLASIEAAWSRLYPNYPFEYSFLSDEFAQLYQEETHFARLARLFAGLAIFIACLGLFGLAAYTAEQRTKEIGVRKVLGASVSGIVALLSKDFARLVLIASLIAAPVGYFAMNRWLQDFAYRIEIEWWVFALAGGIAMLIAVATVSTQAIKAAMRNPVESLRYE